MKENPIVGNDYHKLVDAMIQYAKYDSLPQTLSINDMSNVTMESVASLIADFEKETKLKMVFSAEVENGNLRGFLHVGYQGDKPKKPLLN